MRKCCLQDPMNPNETVIVIRSLVPGGVAQVDGQLIPGDRLLFVNDIALENASLDQAVQALKGAPKGTVRIGVAKPLPIPDSIAQVSDRDSHDLARNVKDVDSSQLLTLDGHTQRQESINMNEFNVTDSLHLIEQLQFQHSLVKSDSF